MPRKQANLYVATSGYSYKGWHQRFYPPDLAQKNLLPFYAEHFNAVEINNSFYRLPTKKAVHHWLEQTPKDFRFCFKVSRYVSHMKRLKDSAEPFKKLLHVLEEASALSGPLLLQLPPRMKPEYERLDECLENFRKAKGRKHWQIAVEFRSSDWYADRLYDILAKHKAALVLHDMPEGHMMEEKIQTAPFLYMRFHGPKGDYGGEYGRRKLGKPAGLLAEAMKDGRDCYVFFNNDRDGYAVEDAKLLNHMVRET